MNRIIKYLLIGLSVIALLIGIGLLFLVLKKPNVGPAQDMTIEITPERVERGEYLANHVMLCMDCHAQRDFSLFAGPPKPGTLGVGGEIFDHSMGFPGTFISRNITPAGLKDWTDGELFRLITTGVKKDGSAIFPVMPYPSYGTIDPEDIKSVIAYIRSLDPIEAEHPVSQADFPMNLIIKTMPKEAEFSTMPSPSDKISYGKYLVKAASCGDCHTDFEKGKYVGEFLGGGREFKFPDGSILRSSNLTPDETGLGAWSKAQFINTFKKYVDSTYLPQKIEPGSFQTIMPWIMYGGMKEEDLGAIYEYLASLDPVENAVIKYEPAGN